jgi:pimeloyl-ACP methyl ester carboxylesterase
VSGSRPKVGLISLGAGLAAAGVGAALGLAAERAALGRPVVGRPVLPWGRGAGNGSEPDAEQQAAHEVVEPATGPAALGSVRGRATQVVTDDGLDLYVEVDESSGHPAAGANLTVVFCHGYALTQDSWHYQRLTMRERGWRAVYWDQRGHGRSATGPEGGATIDQLGRDLAAVLDDVVPTGPVVLIGHSMGGMTIMSLAHERPEFFRERVLGVALISTSAGGLGTLDLGLRGLGRVVTRVAPSAVQALTRSTPGLVERGRRLGSDLETVIVRRWSFDSKVSEELVQFSASMIAATRLEVISDFLPTFSQHDKREALAAMRGLEALVLVGEGDMLTPTDHSEEIARLLPGAEHVVLQHAGHLVMLEHPNVVDEHVGDLIVRSWRASTRKDSALRNGLGSTKENADGARRRRTPRTVTPVRPRKRRGDVT